MQDNQQRSFIINNSVKLITRTEKRNGKWYGLYLCPSCNMEVELRIDTVVTHLKKYNYPKLCSKCGNINAGKKRILHGEIDTRLYSIWKNMRSRTADTSQHITYKNIEVCKEWENFLSFKEWAESNGYKDNLTIDRIDPKKNYTPDNCRWITASENSRRAAIRDNNGKSTKISKDEIPNIIGLLNKGVSHKEIANFYGVARTTITYINNKERSTTISKESTLK